MRSAIGENVGADLRAFIATSSTDLALQTERFLKLKGALTGKKPRPEFQQLATFITRNRYPVGPELVFWENDATLVKAGTEVGINAW